MSAQPSTSSMERRYRRTCDRKKVYGSFPLGWAAVRHIQRNGNDMYPDFELRPYTCEFCGKIHVGHSNNPRSSESKSSRFQGQPDSKETPCYERD